MKKNVTINNKISEIEKHVKWDKYYKLSNESKAWFFISFNHDLSEDFIREFQDYLDWLVVSCRDFSPEFIEEFKEKIDFENFLDTCKYNVSEEFLTKYSTYFDEYVWQRISELPKISLDFISKFSDKLSLDKIYKHNININQEFIEKFKNKFQP